MDLPKKNSPYQGTGNQGAAVSSSSGGSAHSAQTVGSWTAAAAAPSRTILPPGTRLAGRYEILDTIGVGGMGEVYRVCDHDLDQIIALKLVKSELASDSESVLRFKQELLLARRISHRNVVRIFDMRETAGLKFITMEYVEGRTLTGILAEKKKLPAAEAIEIVSQICSGLMAAHDEGVIHRDLKPSNIMRDAQGRVVIMDFGLARSLQGAGMTQTGAIPGTAAYMSPEQATAKPLDARTDLYSVGLIFYELLSGQQLFQAESAVVNIVRRLREPATPVRELEPSVSPALSAIVSKCLERVPADRYRNAEELLTALDRVSGRSTSRSVTQALSAPTPSPALRLISLALALIVLGALAFYAYRRWTSRAIAQHAPVTILVSDFQNNTSDAVFNGTLEPAFSLAMEGAPFISSYNSGTAHKLAAQLHPGATQIDASLARLVAMREGINTIITGSISAKGSSYVVKTEAEDALTEKNLGAAEVTADKSNVLVKMGELAAHIRQDLGDATPISAQMAAAETFTTSSLEAAHEYALGQDAQWAGNYAQAITHYQNSLRADPDLGRAYSGLAVMAYSLGHEQEALNYYKLALSKIDRMSEREKYRTRGTYYTVIRDTDRAIEEFRQLLQRYPSDNAGHANLALAYFYRRDMEHAMEEARHAVELSPKNVHQRNNVGLFAMYAGDFDVAIREQRAVLEMNPSLVKGYLGIALSQAADGHIEEARQTYHQLEKVGAEGASVASAGLADLALYQGDASQAREIINAALPWDLRNKDADAAAVKYSMLAAAESESHSFDKAILAADQALADSQDAGILFFSARAYLQGKTQKVQAKAAQIAQKLTQRTDEDSHAYAKLISGEALLVQGKSQEAIATFKDALKQADAWLVRFDLGRAYLEAGEFAQADSELELCLKRRGEATAAFLDEVPTIRLLPDVYYYLGRAQEGLNSPAATESYKTFLAMKIKAVNDPLVTDARSRSR
jgi:serine/threonine protein kinase/tetratricopeptide (TPR) repeat protein